MGDPASTVSLREISAGNRAVIERLAVTADQALYVASVAHVRTRPDARALLTSIQPGSAGSPRGRYLTYGFATTGETFDGEEVLDLELAR